MNEKEVLCVVKDLDPSCEGSWTIFRDGTFIHTDWHTIFSYWELREIEGKHYFFYKSNDPNDDNWECDCYPSLDKDRPLDVVTDSAIVDAILVAQAMISIVEE